MSAYWYKTGSVDVERLKVNKEVLNTQSFIFLKKIVGQVSQHHQRKYNILITNYEKKKSNIF